MQKAALLSKAKDTPVASLFYFGALYWLLKLLSVEPLQQEGGLHLLCSVPTGLICVLHIMNIKSL